MRPVGVRRSSADIISWGSVRGGDWLTPSKQRVLHEPDVIFRIDELRRGLVDGSAPLSSEGSYRRPRACTIVTKIVIFTFRVP